LRGALVRHLLVNISAARAWQPGAGHGRTAGASQHPPPRHRPRTVDVQGASVRSVEAYREGLIRIGPLTKRPDLVTQPLPSPARRHSDRRHFAHPFRHRSGRSDGGVCRIFLRNVADDPSFASERIEESARRTRFTEPWHMGTSGGGRGPGNVASHRRASVRHTKPWRTAPESWHTARLHGCTVKARHPRRGTHHSRTLPSIGWTHWGDC